MTRQKHQAVDHNDHHHGTLRRDQLQTDTRQAAAMTEDRPCLGTVVCVLTLVHINELTTGTTLPMPTRLVADRGESVQAVGLNNPKL